MSVYDEIFPSHRSPDFVQTEWSEDWHGVAFGFEYAAKHLTENRRGFGATIDAVGLAIFFLQRHRVEIALKMALRDLDAKVPRQHSLAQLWQDFGMALAARDEGTWREVRREHAEFVAAMDGVDPGSFTFRYPVTTEGAKVERPQFVDLDALEKRVTAFTSQVPHAVGWVTESWD